MIVLVGRRVEAKAIYKALIHCTDPFGERLQRGDLGTITLVDDLGTVHVQWDRGMSLGLIPGEDAWKLLPKAKR